LSQPSNSAAEQGTDQDIARVVQAGRHATPAQQPRHAGHRRPEVGVRPAADRGHRQPGGDVARRERTLGRVRRKRLDLAQAGERALARPNTAQGLAHQVDQRDGAEHARRRTASPHQRQEQHQGDLDAG
jgi:hypothetical protein